MTPITCDHAACDARALVFAAYDGGELAFCCHHWTAVRAPAGASATDVIIEPGCTVDDVTREPARTGARTHGRDDDWPALAA